MSRAWTSGKIIHTSFIDNGEKKVYNITVMSMRDIICRLFAKMHELRQKG